MSIHLAHCKYMSIVLEESETHELIGAGKATKYQISGSCDIFVPLISHTTKQLSKKATVTLVLVQKRNMQLALADVNM